MKIKDYSYEFKAGDLVTVADCTHDQAKSVAPILSGLTRKMKFREIRAGDTYLVVKDAQKSTHHDNELLYTEVMTSTGPAQVFCFFFAPKEVYA